MGVEYGLTRAELDAVAQARQDAASRRCEVRRRVRAELAVARTAGLTRRHNTKINRTIEGRTNMDIKETSADVLARQLITAYLGVHTDDDGLIRSLDDVRQTIDATAAPYHAVMDDIRASRAEERVILQLLSHLSGLMDCARRYLPQEQDRNLRAMWRKVAEGMESDTFTPPPLYVVTDDDAEDES